MLFRQHSCGDTGKLHIALEGNAEVVTGRKRMRINLASSVAPYEKESSPGKEGTTLPHSHRYRAWGIPYEIPQFLTLTRTRNWVRDTCLVTEIEVVY